MRLCSTHTVVACVLLFAALFSAVASEGLDDVFISFLNRKNSDGSVDLQMRLPEKQFIRTKSLNRIQVEPSVLLRSGDSVTVSWDGIFEPNENDWLGLYISEDAPYDDYLDYYWVRQSQTSLQGFGEFKFPLINMRRPYIFRYFQSQGEDHYVLLAESEPIFFVNSTEPTQGHIALTGIPGQMRVMFVTNSFKVPVVKYGYEPTQLNMVALGSSKTYTADMICGRPANIVSSSWFIDPGVLHDVLLDNLRPQTTYYYSYGHSNEVFSDIFSFRTAPEIGYNGPIQFAAFGDIGMSEAPGAQSTVDGILRTADETDFVLLFGDISYALGRGYTWEQYMNFMEPLATRVPVMVSIGNHEYCYLDQSTKDPSGATGNGFHPDWGNYGNDGGGECGVPTYYRFHMPEVSNGNSLFWYSFNYGNVHIIQFSTEHDFLPGSPMYQWLESDLLAVNRSITPWVIVTGHRPMYNSEKYLDDFRVAENMQIALEDLFVNHGVDLLLYGHYHSYERTCRVYRNKCDPKGLIHITVGSAGAGLDTAGYFNVEWSEYAAQEHGYSRLYVDNRLLRMDFVRNRDNVVADSLVLTKS
eukprot:TRINITY_DN1026_c0_g1_i1.p1 TRINITY_DN1026_c0_g1~~TRINITY_DN1026_c0_g1_i1.p1  ORF type:complete len:583 (-),score=112.84 TRINITY_DN1026_c0_g1_i1:288-2036(-)